MGTLKLNIIWEQLKRSLAIMKKNIRIYYNKGPVIIQGFLFPIMLFFAFTIGRNIQDEYILSGLMTMTLFLTATSIGPVIFPWETMQKTLERLITCPITIETILLGSIWSSFVFGVIFSTFALIFGVIILGLSNIIWWIMILTILLGGITFSTVALLLSVPPTDTPANTMILTVVIKFPLIFISPVFRPVRTPDRFNPVAYLIDLFNYALGKPTLFTQHTLLIDFGVLILTCIFFLILSFWLHKLVLHKRFN